MEQPYAQVLMLRSWTPSLSKPERHISLGLFRYSLDCHPPSSESTSGKSFGHFFVSNYSSVGNKHDLSGGICSDIGINPSVLR